MKNFIYSSRNFSKPFPGRIQVRKDELKFGDLVIIRTFNSLYLIRSLSNDIYLVSGGWFDRKGLSPSKTTITGCTWGGSMVKLDILAACGLCLEFGNQVITSKIEKVCVIHRGMQN